jgi:hypothetical protein
MVRFDTSRPRSGYSRQQTVAVLGAAGLLGRGKQGSFRFINGDLCTRMSVYARGSLHTHVGIIAHLCRYRHGYPFGKC